MNIEEVKVKFSGFEPTQEVRHALDILLNQLHMKSPSKALLSAKFTLTNGIFEGIIKITSAAENFMVKATDSHVMDLSQKLADRLLTQIDKWKTLRFE
jgi:hypothetical protein